MPQEEMPDVQCHLASPPLPVVPDLIPASMLARKAGGTRQAMPEGFAGKTAQQQKGLENTRKPGR